VRALYNIPMMHSQYNINLGVPQLSLLLSRRPVIGTIHIDDLKLTLGEIFKLGKKS